MRDTVRIKLIGALIALFALLAAVAAVTNARERVAVSVDRNEVELGRPVTVTVRAYAGSRTAVDLSGAESSLKGFDIVGRVSGERSFLGSKRIVVRFRAVRYDPGTYEIGGFTARFTRGDGETVSIRTKSLQVDVRSVLGKKYALDDFTVKVDAGEQQGRRAKRIDSPIALEIADQEKVIPIWTYAGALDLASIVGAVSIFALGGWALARRVAARRRARPRNPYDKASDAIRGLVADAPRRSPEAIAAELDSAVREYLASVFRVSAGEATGKALLHELAATSVFTDGEKTVLSRILDLGQLVKYTGLTPRPEEPANALKEAEELFSGISPERREARGVS